MERNHVPHIDDPHQQIFPTNPQELRPPSQNPPPNITTTRSHTPSPTPANGGELDPNHLRGSSEFPPGGSPVPPGTTLSTDYSSMESIDAASTEHAETLLRIVTPPEFGGDGESSEEGEEGGRGRGRRGRGRGQWRLVRYVCLSGGWSIH